VRSPRAKESLTADAGNPTNFHFATALTRPTTNPRVTTWDRSSFPCRKTDETKQNQNNNNKKQKRKQQQKLKQNKMGNS